MNKTISVRYGIKPATNVKKAPADMQYKIDISIAANRVNREVFNTFIAIRKNYGDDAALEYIDKITSNVTYVIRQMKQILGSKKEKPNEN